MLPLEWELKAAGLLAVLLALWGGYRLIEHQGDLKCQLKQASLVSSAEAAASASEATWKAQVLDGHRASEIQIQNITADRDAAIASLRDRPPRRVYVPGAPASAPECAAATGSELSREDAQFLAGFAANRAIEAAHLSECQVWIKSVTGAK